MWVIEWAKKASEQLKDLPAQVRVRVEAKIKTMSLGQMDPMYHPNIKKLEGHALYRLRVSEYRVIYEMVESRVTIVVIRIDHRKKAYRRLDA